MTLKNLILKYIGMKNINILKRKCHFGINVDIEDIETVRCISKFHEKHCHYILVLSFSMWPFYFYKSSAGVRDFLTNKAIVLYL
jgi:hypothetical protein